MQLTTQAAVWLACLLSTSLCTPTGTALWQDTSIATASGGSKATSTPAAGNPSPSPVAGGIQTATASNAGGAAACSPSATIVPSDVPTDYAFYSGQDAFYKLSVPLTSSQGWLILNGNHTTWDSGSTGNNSQQINSYAQGVAHCASACQTHSCTSFNVFTLAESDVNGCQPTWGCRVASDSFTANDYEPYYAAVYSIVYDKIPPKPSYAPQNTSCVFNPNSPTQDPCLWESYSVTQWLYYQAYTQGVTKTATNATGFFYHDFLARVASEVNYFCHL
jgi:hypothetical protein